MSIKLILIILILYLQIHLLPKIYLFPKVNYYSTFTVIRRHAQNSRTSRCSSCAHSLLRTNKVTLCFFLFLFFFIFFIDFRKKEKGRGRETSMMTENWLTASYKAPPGDQPGNVPMISRFKGRQSTTEQHLKSFADSVLCREQNILVRDKRCNFI